MKKIIEKILTAGISAAMLAQTAAVPSFADATAVAEYKETVKSLLNISDSFKIADKATHGNKDIELSLFSCDDTDTTDGEGMLDYGIIKWDETQQAIKLQTYNKTTTDSNGTKKYPTPGFYFTKGESKTDMYIEFEFMCEKDAETDVPSSQIAAMVPGGKIQGTTLSTGAGEYGYTYGKWVSYRVVYEYDSTNEKYSAEMFIKKDGKYESCVSENNVSAKKNDGSYKIYGTWADGGQVCPNGGVKDAALYIKKAKVAKLDSGAESIFPQMISMSGSGEKLELNVNIDLDPASVTAANLDIPTGTVTNVSYADKKITITGTGLKAAFLTENILSADGMPAKTNSYENKVNDSTLMEWDITTCETDTEKNSVKKYAGTMTYVPANKETGERAYVDMSKDAGVYGKANITEEGYLDWGVKTVGEYGAYDKVQTLINNLGIRLQGGRWAGSGFNNLADNHEWMDFRMLIRKNADGNLERKWLLKNADGIYEALGNWTVAKDKDGNTNKINSWFQVGANSSNGETTLSAQMSEFKYTNAAESTWYPEIIGQESYLDGKLLRIYTNRPLLGSTVNADTVILSSGTATDFITSGSTVTVVGEGLTTAQLTSEVATAEGLRGAKAEVVPTEAKSIKYLDGAVQCTFDRELADYEIALLDEAQLVCTGTGEAAVTSAEYDADTKTLTLKYGELTSVCYSQEDKNTGAAKYKIVLPERYFENSSYTYTVAGSTVYQYLNVGADFADSTKEDIAFSLTAADKEGDQKLKLSFSDRTENEREHINATGDFLIYGMKSMFSSEFYIDMCVNAENISEDGKFSIRFANCNENEGSWTDGIAKSGKNAWAGSDRIYVGEDGYADIRICFQKDNSGNYLKSIYSKDENGVYRIAKEPENVYTWTNQVQTKVQKFSYMTTTGSAGVKINSIKLYKTGISGTIPKIKSVSYNADGADVVFTRHMRADSIIGDNITLYDTDGEIIEGARFGYDDATKTLAITGAGIIDKIAFSKNLVAANGMSVADGTEAVAYTEGTLKINDSDGNLITSTAGVRQALAEMTIENHNPNNIGKKKTVVIAAYDSEERLIGVKHDTEEIKDGTIELSAKLKISSDAAKFKAFLWDGEFAEMRPTGDPIVTVPGTQSVSIESISGAYDAVILAEDKEAAYVRGIKTQISAPISENGVLMAAAEDLAEFTLSPTEGDSAKVTVYYTDKEITFTNGSAKMSVTDRTKQTAGETALTAAAKTVGGKLYVPVSDYVGMTDMKLNPYVSDYAVFGSGTLTNTSLTGNASKILKQLLSAEVTEEPMATFYVDPQAAEGTADTFATIEEAVSAVRKYKQTHGMTGDIVVQIKDGTYFTNGISLTAEDSGENGYNVIYKAYPGATSRIISGEKISGFTEYENGIYRAATDKTGFYLLSEDGKTAHKARYPDAGYNKTAKPTAAKNTEFTFASEDVPTLKNPQGAEVSLWPGGETGTSSWSHKFAGISSVDYSAKKVYLSESTGTVIGKNTRYFVQDDYNLLNCAGEYYADGEYLYYKPYGDNIAESEIFIPNKADIFSLTGDSYDRRIKNIKFSGLTFEGADNNYHAIDVLYGAGIDISDCHFKNIGGNGVNVQKSYDVNVSDSEFLNIGKSGVNISGSTLVKNTLAGFNRVYSNYFDGLGKVEPGEASGVGLSAVDHCYIANNRINDSTRFGINVNSNKAGFSKTSIAYEEWDDYTRGCYTVVENNDISDACNDSNDGGGIYMWCAGVGNVIRRNRIHHSNAPYSYWFPLYLDDGTNKTSIYDNIIDNNQYEQTEGYIEYVCFLKGVGNVMLNNIIVNNQNYAGADKSFANFGTHSMGNMPNDSVENFQNIYYNSGHDIVHIEPSVNNTLTHTPMTTRIAKQDKNLYYNDEHTYLPDIVTKDYANREEDIGATITTLDDWRAWQNNKYDQASLFDQDPCFENVTEEDFRLKKDSPAYSLGFTDIDFGAIGLAKGSALHWASDPIERAYIISANGKNSCETLSAGTSVDLSATGRTEKGVYLDSANAEISWQSQNSAVAAVDQNGHVTAVAAGSTAVTATLSYGGATRTIAMTVEVK